MIQASEWEDPTTDESNVHVHTTDMAGDDLRMPYGKLFVFQDV
jgi:hypothetical protein